ncbi:PspC domain-containing protein [Streptomyces sp. NPDC088554]|uniref:PspC domain-containing protein n=1 Tax=Streptomyces sp. NPDC088554 TaxID=3365865 RepID=UPI00381F7761
MTQPPPQQPPAPPAAPPPAPGSASPPPPPPSATPSPEPPRLRRSPRQKVFAGVCGGLGRYCDVDPVIFRIVIGVLTVTGGIGLIFYGFAWLLIPLDGQEENEGRKLLSGRVDGASLIAVLFALIGCGLFLSMLDNGGMLGFAAMLSIAVAGAAVWSQRRRVVPSDGVPLDPSTAQAVAEAPPETKAPPPAGTPSWWRDPIVKDGRTGPSSPGPAGTDYLWGPDSPVTVHAQPWRWHTGATPLRSPRLRVSRGIAGRVFLLALLAAGLGTGLSWDHQPLGTSLEIGLAAALVVFGLGLALSSLLGRTGLGTVLLTLITAGLLTGAATVPKDVTTEWHRQTWAASSAADVKPRYELRAGTAVLDLSGLTVPKGRTVHAFAEVGAGKLKVVLPKGMMVTTEAHVGFGEIRFPDQSTSEVNISPDRTRMSTISPVGADRTGELELKLEVGLGQVEVANAAS